MQQARDVIGVDRSDSTVINYNVHEMHMNVSNIFKYCNKIFSSDFTVLIHLSIVFFIPVTLINVIMNAVSSFIDDCFQSR